MKSDLPKVLCPVLGRPMIAFVLDALAVAGVKRVIAVVGYRADDVKAALSDRKQVEFALQTERLGTGHAVKWLAVIWRSTRWPVIVVAGGLTPLQQQSVAALLDHFYGSRPACCWERCSKTTHGGWADRAERLGEFQGIVEEKDAPPQAADQEVNMSTTFSTAANFCGSTSLRMTTAGRVLSDRLPRHLDRKETGAGSPHPSTMRGPEHQHRRNWQSWSGNDRAVELQAF
jgi:bifunctional UDP-N-acetylglucosamine pyrophosphorylase/glucosamine-1-phosphate N-acetyltransferase/UDP-N-acetylglucosamine pyrophosphorylase